MAKVKGASFSLGFYAKEYLEGKKGELGVTMSEYVKCLVFKDMMAGGTDRHDIELCNKALDIAELSSDFNTAIDFYRKNAGDVALNQPSKVSQPTAKSKIQDRLDEIKAKMAAQKAGINIIDEEELVAFADSVLDDRKDNTAHNINHNTDDNTNGDKTSLGSNITVDNISDNTTDNKKNNIESKNATFAMDAPIQNGSEML